jgi:poly(3-hydroxybutyrate) depolymerase
VRQGVSRESKADDVGFLLGLLDRVNGAYRVDRARVYVTGASNGGC